jgi:Nucleoside-diphosphate-sugar epimerases
MSTYVVTGGAGFIGSHIAEALLRQNQMFASSTIFLPGILPISLQSKKTFSYLRWISPLVTDLQKRFVVRTT